MGGGREEFMFMGVWVCMCVCGGSGFRGKEPITEEDNHKGGWWRVTVYRTGSQTGRFRSS